MSTSYTESLLEEIWSVTLEKIHELESGFPKSGQGVYLGRMDHSLFFKQLTVLLAVKENAYDVVSKYAQFHQLNSEQQQAYQKLAAEMTLLRVKIAVEISCTLGGDATPEEWDAIWDASSAFQYSMGWCVWKRPLKGMGRPTRSQEKIPRKSEMN